MDTFGDKVLSFYHDLPDHPQVPTEVEVLYPHRNAASRETMNDFYQKLNRYQIVLNKNSRESNQFRLEDFYRNGLMVLDHNNSNFYHF